MTSSADRLGLALSDLHAVSDVASALAEGDQSIVRVSDGRSYLDPYVPRLLETGLVITYMRLFTKARGYGDDGRSPEEWVPEEHRELHRFLVTRRHKHE